MNDSRNFTQGRIFAPLVRFALPVLLALFLQTMYGAVDLLVVGQFGTAADVSAVSTGSQLMHSVTVVITGLAMGLTAFVAQNIGAGKPERARRALLCGIVSSLAAGIVMASLTFFHGQTLAGFFAKDPAVILAAAEYLKAYAVDCLLTSFLFCFMGYFNGCSCTTFVMLQGIIGAFGVRLPVSWLMSRQVPVSLFRIGLATPASTTVQILLCGVYFLVLLRRQRREALR